MGKSTGSVLFAIIGIETKLSISVLVIDIFRNYKIESKLSIRDACFAFEQDILLSRKTSFDAGRIIRQCTYLLHFIKNSSINGAAETIKQVAIIILHHTID